MLDITPRAFETIFTGIRSSVWIFSLGMDRIGDYIIILIDFQDGFPTLLRMRYYVLLVFSDMTYEANRFSINLRSPAWYNDMSMTPEQKPYQKSTALNTWKARPNLEEARFHAVYLYTITVTLSLYFIGHGRGFPSSLSLIRLEKSYLVHYIDCEPADVRQRYSEKTSTYMMAEDSTECWRTLLISRMVVSWCGMTMSKGNPGQPFRSRAS